MEAHQVRVVEEKKELDEKLEKLNQFINNSDVFIRLDSVDCGLLEDQAEVMQEYSRILGIRIARF
jgi:hypothetical protein